MKNTSFRWGILGTAQIARKNWQAIRQTERDIVVAVASRDLQKSKRFISECQQQIPFPICPKPFGSYEELLASKDIDGVYIPLPTGIRKEWVLKAAAAKKHVLCEKPCAISPSDLLEMTEACRRNKVQFMDGVMFMHSARLIRMREVLNDGAAVGKMRRITSAFTFGAPKEFFTANIRADATLEPHGCLGDLGWYCIRFALWAMDWKMPREVSGRILAETSASVPTEFSGELLFDGGVSAGFYCSFITDLQQWGNISGTEGYLHVDDFVLPFFGSELKFKTDNAMFNINGCQFNMEPHRETHRVLEYSNSHATAQETNLFRHFAADAQSGKINRFWPDVALKTQQVMNACLESARQDGRSVALSQRRGRSN